MMIRILFALLIAVNFVCILNGKLNETNNSFFLTHNNNYVWLQPSSVDATRGAVATANASRCLVGVMDTKIARMAVMKNVMLQTMATNNFQCKSWVKREMTLVLAMLLNISPFTVC